MRLRHKATPLRTVSGRRLNQFEHLVQDPGGDVVFGYDGTLRLDVQALRDTDWDRCTSIIVNDGMSPRVLELVRAKGTYEGLDLSRVRRFSLRYATVHELDRVGKMPGVDIENQALVFYANPLRVGTDDVKAALRNLLAQPVLETDFERTHLGEQLTRAGVISEDKVLRLRDIATWRAQDFKGFSGARSVTEPFEEPLVINTPQWGVVRYGQGKSKGIIQPGGVLQPSCEQYERPVEQMPGEIKIPVLNSRGCFEEAEQDNPLGGMPYSVAVNEARITNIAFERGVCLDFVVESGMRREQRCRSGNMGCVNLVTPGEDDMVEFIDRWGEVLEPFAKAYDFSSGSIRPERVDELQRMGGLAVVRENVHGLLMDYGQILDKVSGADLFNAFAHITNAVIYTGRPKEFMYMKDWSEGLDLAGQSAERKVGYRAIMLAVAWHHMNQLPHFETEDKQVKIQTALGFNPYPSLLMGYFRGQRGDPRVYVGQFHDGRHAPLEGQPKSVDPFNMGKILGYARDIPEELDGTKTPVWKLNIPEIDLMWAKMRGCTAAGDLSPNMIFVFDEGVRLKQGIPLWVDQESFETQAVRLMSKGYSSYSITPIEADAYRRNFKENGKPQVEFNKEQQTVSIWLPKEPDMRDTGKNVVKLLRQACAYLEKEG